MEEVARLRSPFSSLWKLALAFVLCFSEVLRVSVSFLVLRTRGTVLVGVVVFLHLILVLFIDGSSSYLRDLVLFVDGSSSYLRDLVLFVDGSSSYLRGGIR